MPHAHIAGQADEVRMPPEENTETSVDSTPEPKYTDADMQRVVQTRLSKEAKKYESQLAELQAKAAKSDELSARLAELEEAAEMAGKTAVEKEQARFQREFDKLRRDAEEKAKAIAERDAQLSEYQRTLQQERTSRALMDAMSAAKVIRPEKAAKAAMLDIQIEHTDEGMRASYGDVHEGTIAEALAAWTKDNDHFLPAPAGGAGTRANSGGRHAKPLHEMSDEDLLRLGSR